MACTQNPAHQSMAIYLSNQYVSDVRMLVSNVNIFYCQILDDKEPFHPTEVFDMIVGTSTGGLIAMGLLAGNVNNGKRTPMTVQECINLYMR